LSTDPSVPDGQKGKLKVGNFTRVKSNPPLRGNVEKKAPNGNQAEGETQNKPRRSFESLENLPILSGITENAEPSDSDSDEEQASEESKKLARLIKIYIDKKRKREQLKENLSNTPTSELLSNLQLLYNSTKIGQTNFQKCEEFTENIKKITEETKQVQTRKNELEARNLHLQSLVKQRKQKVFALVLTLQHCIKEEEKDKKFLAFVESKLD